MDLKISSLKKYMGIALRPFLYTKYIKIQYNKSKYR